MEDATASLNFGLPLEQRRTWKAFLASYGLQALAVLVLLELSMWAPVQVATKRAYEAVTLTQPVEVATQQPHAKVAPVHVEQPKIVAAVHEPRPVLRAPEVKTHIEPAVAPKVQTNVFIPAVLAQPG